MKITITTLQGLESVLAKELKGLNLTNIKIANRAVECEGSWSQVYRCNYLLRTAIRVLIPIREYTITDEQELYDAIASVDWTPYIKKKTTIAITAVVFSDYFTNSRYVTYKAKDAIVDQLRDKYGQRPNVDLKNPDTLVHLFIKGDKLIVSLDSSGQSLHLRNYKERFYKAPLNEVLAAGMIQLSEWDKKKTLVDPMCGSGTLVTEALMYASNLPAGYYIEEFGFERWQEFYPDMWKLVVENAEEDIIEPEVEIHGSDLNGFAVRDAKKNIQRLPFREKVKLYQRDLFKLPAIDESHIIMNPPYDSRVEIDNIYDFYKSIGDCLKNYWQGSDAWVFTSRADAMKSFGLRSTRKFTLDNGGTESKLYKFELYKGSKKAKHQS
jgi:putative N6-adenine-specific DNA methylase